MSSPAWFDAIATAYLAGEASLFVVCATDRAAVCAELVRRLSASRQIVGVATAEGLSFPNLGDLTRFENLWEARRVLAGGRFPPGDVLARIWAVLEVGEVSQGWIIADGERLASARTSSVAPPLAAWTDAPRVRAANHLIVVIVSDVRALDPALTSATRVLDGTEPVLQASATAPEVAPAEPDAATERPAAPADLAEQLATAFDTSLPGWPGEAFPSRAPFLAAIAEVLAATGALPPVAVRFESPGGLVVEGPGAAAFQTIWRSDLALDAALGTIAKTWEPPATGFPPGAVPPLDATGLRVLAKRLIRGFYST